MQHVEIKMFIHGNKMPIILLDILKLMFQVLDERRPFASCAHFTDNMEAGENQSPRVSQMGSPRNGASALIA